MAGFSVNSTIGEYRVVGFLGAGGMGEVYRAVHSKIDRVVAIKILTQPGHDSDFFKRFLNEARIQASLHHQNIATLYDFVESGGRPCIVMEYVDGDTLAERISNSGRLPMGESLAIMKVVLEAIAYIHSNHIIHRDIKSNNIKIDSRGQVKLLDFGIARADSEPKLTATGSVIGTLHYLSPEQIKGAGADARSDIWALGILFYEMVTGAVPFQGTNAFHLSEKINKVSYVPPSVANPSCPPEAEAVITRCLRKSPSDRYQSAAEMLRDIQILAGKAPEPPTSLAHVPASGKILRRLGRSWPVAASIFAALALVTALVLYLTSETPQAGKDSPTPSASTPADSAPTGGSPEMRTVMIDVSEGRADVYRDQQWVGRTPFELKGRLGERIDLVLKREGCEDRSVEFSVSAGKSVYTFPMKEKK